MSGLTRRRQAMGDEGVSLVLALVFLLVVGLFSIVALSKSQATLIAGGSMRERGQLQYELDGGVDRGAQVLRSEMTSADPGTCAQAASPSGSGTLTVNGVSTDWSCTLLAGRAKASTDKATTDYAIVITNPASGSLKTSNGSSTLQVAGSVYMSSPLDSGEVKTNLALTGGDLVGPAAAGCSTFGSFSAISVDAGYLKTCTEQTLATALPTVSLGSAPTFNASTSYRNGLDVLASPGHHCRVFFPGLYTAAPNLTNGANYFVSGPYYFNNIGTWSVTGNSVSLSGGQRTVSTDTPALSDDCAGITDVLALAASGLAVADLSSISATKYTGGVTFVLAGNSVLDVPKGDVTLYTPPKGASSLPLSIVAFDAVTNGYAPIAGSLASPVEVVTGSTNNTHLLVNAKIYLPSAGAFIFSTNNTLATAQGGIVAAQLTLKASTSGSGSLAISTPSGLGSPPPPFRTLRIISSVTGNNARNTAVLTISNFAPYTVLTKSWRTS